MTQAVTQDCALPPKERPILFSAPMARAILDGRKTVTRRICRTQPEPWKSHYLEGGCHNGDWAPAPCDDGTWDLVSTFAASEVPCFGRCPYGSPGDRLWVRESCWLKSFEVLLGNTLEFGVDHEHYGREWAGLRKDYVLEAVDEGEPLEPPNVWYAADGELPALPEWGRDCDMRWERRNSIHMPRWASRLLLEVTDVRVERLHAISEQDAIAEGVDEVGFPRETFARLWDSINGKRAEWASNPWVWRVGFRVMNGSADLQSEGEARD